MARIFNTHRLRSVTVKYELCSTANNLLSLLRISSTERYLCIRAVELPLNFVENLDPFILNDAGISSKIMLNNVSPGPDCSTHTAFAQLVSVKYELP